MSHDAEGNYGKNLRINKSGRQLPWTFEQIKAGLESFKLLHSRYPTAQEIDSYQYLPSSRSIQRSLGGLESVRTKLGFDLDQLNFTKGTARSTKAKKIYANSVEYEETFYNYLIKIIPEVKVHEHKILRPGHVCCDFFIYTSDKNGFAIDVFYAKDLFTAKRVINIKLKRYVNLNCDVYFVIVGNSNIRQSELDSVASSKKIKLPKNIKITTEEYFKKAIFDLIIS
jgi:hypothetical protein